MDSDNGTSAISPNEEFEVAIFRPSDAAGIGDLFRSVYGDRYPIKVFYDEAALTRANAEGTYHSIVARSSTGKVVGVQHAFRSAPNPRIYEAGAGLVLKEYRQLGLSRVMLQYLFEEWIPSQAHIEETFGEAVCNHTHMQRTMSGLNHVETALEIALMPAEAYDQEGSATGRVAALLGFRCFRPQPHRVYLPRCYETELRFLYSGYTDERTFDVADRDLPADAATEATVTVFEFAQVARVAVNQMGSDLGTYLARVQAECRAKHVVVMQVWLPLSDPAVGAGVELLRRHEYFIGGPLPRWFGTDGLLMQKLFVDPNFAGIKLYSDRAKQILALLKADWERTSEHPGTL